MVDGYPTVLVIDHTGKIVYRDYGFEDDELIEKLVRAAEKD